MGKNRPLYVNPIDLVLRIFESIDEFLGDVDPCDCEEVPVLLFGASFVHLEGHLFVDRVGDHAQKLIEPCDARSTEVSGWVRPLEPDVNPFLC